MTRPRPITEEKVLETVRQNIADALRVPVEKIAPETSLVQDLGAESLDFLDINYRMEQSFGIRTARHFVIEHIEELFGEGAAVDESGRLTEKGAEVLRLRLGDHAELKAGMALEDVPALVTVGAVASAIRDILDTLPEACPQCGKSEWISQDGTHVRCGACAAPAPYATGDDLVRDWLRRVQDEKKIF
ncbi:MAG TPA: phosphopantetheine-binding protein [Candidatus Acidoferrales bacterium]|nr:phosphopantetheine-binding protein [Candidatus Acidoferrales bacterium]